jgi:hypothetical protein
VGLEKGDFGLGAESTVLNAAVNRSNGVWSVVIFGTITLSCRGVYDGPIQRLSSSKQKSLSIKS